MNKSILITGANAGLGKETARQLALKSETTRIIMACRNPQKAEIAKKELEELTGKKIFEILIMDISSIESVKNSIQKLNGSIDALIMNAGGMGGRTPQQMTDSGMNFISATNLLGHVVLVEELLKENRINNVVLFASSEAARGMKKMGIKKPSLKTNSVDELASILNGTYFDKKFDPMEAYAHVKYVGTLWMSSLSRKYPKVKFVSISPGATSGTAAADNAPLMMKFIFKYIMMPIIMPLRGMVHKVDKGAKRYIDAIENPKYKTGGFYASKETMVIGDVVDQFPISPVLANEVFQDNAYDAVHKFIRS